MDVKKTQGFVEAMWDRDILPSLKEYITIPALSPDFDKEWEKTGHIDRAMRLIAEWCGAREIPGMKLEIVKLPGRSPLLFMEIPGKTAETVMLYGHMDKQPPVTGWREGLGPWTPVIEDGKLYGRGGADDGYAAYTALAAIEAVQAQGLPHARCVVLIEASEESGSPDLPDYIEHLKARIGVPSLIVCLDSGAGNYDQLWSTTSLRGLVAGRLTVQVLREGAHSGGAGGVVPSSFRIARALLSRIEDEHTGEILLPEFHVDIPAARRKEITEVAKVLGDTVYSDWPMMPGMKPMGDDLAELILNNTWRPNLAVVGGDGLPASAGAGNVLRAFTTLKLSLRLPPRADPVRALAKVKQVLESDPPYGAAVRFDPEGPGSGWDAPPLAPWLDKALDESSKTYFGKPACFMGEGGSIPFMAMLGEKFPKAQFLITGVLGPQSNAHGPNEFLHIPAAKKLTCCTAHVLSKAVNLK